MAGTAPLLLAPPPPPPSSSRLCALIVAPGSIAVAARTRLEPARRLVPAPAIATRSTNAVSRQLEEEEDRGEELDEEQFVEVGVVISKHGVRGELLVRSSTDFPKERFEQPGLRWLKVPRQGKHRIEPVQLLGGRNRPGKLPCWLVSLKNVTTPEQAALLVGSSMLVKRDERPALEEDEFYTPELKGMQVAVQSTGETVGVVDDVFNFGAQDVLRVRRTDGPLIWIPFVEAIVPEVDMRQRKMLITPPDGLLDLNLSKRTSSGSGTRKEELKARRKLQERMSGLKKSLAKCRQDHLLARLNTKGEEKDLLLRQLLNIDFKSLSASFQDALERSRKDYPERPVVHRTGISTSKWWSQGLQMLAENRVAVVSFTSSPELSLKIDLLEQHAGRILELQRKAAIEFPDPEVSSQVPWFAMTSSELLESLSSCLEQNHFFGLDPTQVCPLPQETRPVFDVNQVEGSYRVHLETPRKVAESLTGPGGVVKALLAEGLVDEFCDKGVDYLQIYDAESPSIRAADPLLLGFAQEQQSHLSLEVVPLRPSNAEVVDYNVVREASRDTLMRPVGSYVLSTAFLKQLHKSDFKFELYTQECQVPCSQQGQATGLRLEYSLLHCMMQCPADKVSILHAEGDRPTC